DADVVVHQADDGRIGARVLLALAARAVRGPAELGPPYGSTAPRAEPATPVPVTQRLGGREQPGRGVVQQRAVAPQFAPHLVVACGHLLPHAPSAVDLDGEI